MALFTAILVASLKAVGFAILLLVLRGLVWFLNMLLIAPATDPLRKVPGPTGTPFESHLCDILDPSLSPKTHKSWRKLYGDTFKFHGFGRHDYRLVTFDSRALTHILTSGLYEKPWQTRHVMTRLVGRGIFSMEGDEHRTQRKVVAPAFSSQSIRNLAPIFLDKAEELCDVWDAQISQGSTEEANIDMFHWLTRASFDIIGLAGFDYPFNSLRDESDRIYKAYQRMFRVPDQGFGLRDLAELYFPILETLKPTPSLRIVQECRREINEAGQAIVSRKTARILTKEESDDKDILSLLIKNNIALEPSQRLTDTELMDQCTTFLMAGSDSVSVAITYCLFELATHPDIQNELHAQVETIRSRRVSDDYESDDSDDSFDSGYAEASKSKNLNQASYLEAIDSLPFLDRIVRESLRLTPAVHSTIRTAIQDDEIPLSNAIIVDGKPTKTLKVRKGSYIHIPIEGLNQGEEIWGPDALQFNPDRWDPSSKSKAAYAKVPGLGNSMTFGYGPQSCVGFKFTVCEIKVLVATLVFRFSFSIEEGIEIERRNNIISRPFVVGRYAEGPQLPLKVRRRT